MTKSRSLRGYRRLPVALLLVALGTGRVAYPQSPDGALIAVMLLREVGKTVRGVRGGFGIEPDHFYGGVHFGGAPGPGRLRFRPNIEVGYGDDTLVWGLNGEIVYFTPFPWERGRLYFGGGPALNISRIRSPLIQRTDTGPGINLLLGMAQPGTGIYVEVKGGLIDSPSFKVGIGYTFR